MKRVFTLLILSTILSCAVSKDSENQNTAQARQNKLIDDAYGPLVGTYDGKVTGTNHGDEKVQLVIYIGSDAASNPNGTPGTRKVPRAFFRRVDPIVIDYSLNANGFSPEVGELSLISDGKTPGLKSIEANVAMGSPIHIVGSVQLDTGTLGQMDVTFTTRNTSSPDQFRDRLLLAYQKIQGEYIGNVISPGSGKKPIPVIISLIAMLNGETPAMFGFYKRPDVSSGVIDLPLTVSYQPDSSPPVIAMHGKGSGKYEIDITGTIVNDEINAQFNSLFEGYLGTVVAHRTLHTPTVPPPPPANPPISPPKPKPPGKPAPKPGKPTKPKRHP